MNKSWVNYSAGHWDLVLRGYNQYISKGLIIVKYVRALMVNLAGMILRDNNSILYIIYDYFFFKVQMKSS